MSATQLQSKPTAADEKVKETAKSEEASEKKADVKSKKEARSGGSGGKSKLARPRRSSGKQTVNNTQQRITEACRMLRGWPSPSAKHLSALNEFFEKCVKDNAVGLDELDRRAEFVRAVEIDADSKLQRLHLTGSARNGFALSGDESNVLIELLLTNEATGNADKTEKEKTGNADKDKIASKAKAGPEQQSDGGKTKSEGDKGDSETANDTEEADKSDKGKAKAKLAKARKAELVNRKRSALERIVDAATRRSCELVERSDDHVLVRERTGTVYRFRFAPPNNSSYIRTAVENAVLLRKYVTLDPQCRAVGILLAQLAATLQLDSLEDSSRRGPSPPSSVRDQLAALTVYFFQKAKGIVPCLHQLLSAEQKEKDKEADKSAEPAKSEEQNADSKVNEAVDGEDKDKHKSGKDRRKRSGTREVRRRPLVNVSEWQQNVISDLYTKWKKEREATAEAAGKKIEQESIAELFLGLLSFIAFDLDPLATVVSLSSSRAVVRRAERRGWSSFEAAGYLFVEDVSRSNLNLCSALRTADSWRALNYRMIAAFRYFATPVIVRPSADEKKPAPTRLFDNVKIVAVHESLDSAAAGASADAEGKLDSTVTEKGDSVEDKDEEKKDEKDEGEAAKKDEDPAAATKQNGGAPKRRHERDRTKRTVVRRTVVDSDEAGWYSAKLIETLQNDGSVTFVYEWLAETILSHFPVAALRPSAKPNMTATPVASAAATAANTVPASTTAEAPERERETKRRNCEICRRDHPESSADCPVVKRCALERGPLRKISRAFAWHISELIFTLHERCEPTDHEIELKQKVIDDVFAILTRTVHPNTRVDVYGSCANGFEYRGSDMDLCVTFGEIQETPTRSWQVNRLRKFADILRQSGVPFRVVKLIESARVPIIKFRHVPTQVFGDVCLYNLLALENTALMRTYSKIDSRVPVLGTMLKSFVKQMRINDASQRTLSSYAYLNMLVYFLQHCSPSVLPVLQELHDGAPSKKGKQQSNTAAPQRVVNGKNVWFQSNMDYIRAHFNVGQNTKTFAELWVEFLHFFAHKFNYKDQAVSIRQSKPLKKSDKNWAHGHGLCFAIEDPFEIDHNLGDVLAPDTMARILGIFRSAYQLFTDEAKFDDAFKDKKKEFRELRKYFFKLNVAPAAEAPIAKNANAKTPASQSAEKQKNRLEREPGSAHGEKVKEQRERRPRRQRVKKEKNGAVKQQSNGPSGQSKRDGKADDGDDDVHIGARNDADENDAFDSAESSPKKSSI